ncbi:hypothetical protein ACFO4N_02645 [Camelliibacillus cellulosilyticus]|uniref:Uncharacterized protein n=1 Tax=Camelliibacillus cellulosilyticus TaxID=2174486 RepID=A0ABV9GIC0_9BACL
MKEKIDLSVFHFDASHDTKWKIDAFVLPLENFSEVAIFIFSTLLTRG